MQRGDELVATGAYLTEGKEGLYSTVTTLFHTQELEFGRHVHLSAHIIVQCPLDNRKAKIRKAGGCTCVSSNIV
jgi:hypothetical protein